MTLQLLKGGAAVEQLFTHFGYIGADIGPGKGGTAEKCLGADLGNTVGQGDVLQLLAVRKGVLTDGLQIPGEGNVRQGRAAGKRIARKMLNGIFAFAICSSENPCKQVFFFAYLQPLVVAEPFY